MKQMDSETVDDYGTSLRQKAEYCDFTEKEKELKSQIIQGCKSAKVKRKVLQENLDLQKLLLTARIMELEKPNDFEWEQTNKLKTHKTKRYPVQSNKQHQNCSSVSQNKGVKYRNCDGDFPHQHGPCPAKGKFFSYCKKRNHFVSLF